MTDTLTIGIELEFIAVFDRYAFTNKMPGVTLMEYEGGGPEQNYIGAGQAIYRCLEHNGIKASSTPTFERWYVHEDRLELSRNEKLAVPPGFLVDCIEISSRKLKYADDWEQELELVLEILQRMRDYFACEFLTNTSTGLHVHIGDVSGISLDTAKRMAQIATVHERNLDGLHSAERVFPLIAAELMDLDDNFPFPLYAGLSFFHASSAKPGNGKLIIDFMQDIECSRTLTELGSNLNRVKYQGEMLSGHSCTLNFDNLYRIPQPNLSRPVNIKGTIEFRQHAGDLNDKEIISYIKVLACLTGFCMTAADSDVFVLVANGVDITFGLRDLLEFIECDDATVQHFCARTPRNLTKSSCPALQPLMDVNDRECAARRTPQAIAAAIDQKIKSGVYGIDFDVPVSLSEEEFNWMLSCAEADILEFSTNISTKVLESQAREMTFRKLSELYLASIQPDNQDRDTIAKIVLNSWISKYIGSKYDEREVEEDDENMDEDMNQSSDELGDLSNEAEVPYISIVSEVLTSDAEAFSESDIVRQLPSHDLEDPA